MGWFSRLFSSDKASSPDAGEVRASWDASRTTTNNENHWSNADSLSPHAAVKKAVRKKLRERARYEVANNSYARGIINTISNDTIGSGPHLQMVTDSDDFDREVERLFNEWAAEIGLREKLITGRKARLESGEIFFVFITNEKLTSPIKLDIKVVESDQVTDEDEFIFSAGDEDNADGIKFDKAGNPVTYTIQNVHPGSDEAVTDEEKRVAASEVVHMFRADRPGQPRGVPEIAAALPLFAIMRRYTLAVVSAAETAANNAYQISTQHTSLDADNIDFNVTPFDVVDMERNMATVMPAGWKADQMKAEQPTDTYPEFKHEIINEVARCLSVPFNIAAGNSSSYNYASGRLDHQSYFADIKIEQSYESDTILFHTFEKWMAEALRANLFGNIVVPIDMGDINEVHKAKKWFWDGHGQQDPLRESKSQEVRLNIGLTSLSIEAAKDGHDWKDIVRQRAREQRMMEEEGLIDPLALKTMDADQYGGNPDDLLTNSLLMEDSA